MRLRSFFGLLFAVAVAFVAAYHVKLNDELLDERFHLGPDWSIPVWGAVLGAFLAGFLPVAVTLVVDTLRHELQLRRERRRRREEDGLDSTYRRAVDHHADGQLARAAQELEEYLAGRPESFAGLLRYGMVLRELGRTDEAVEVHRRASTLYPLSPAVLYQLAEDYSEREEPDVAREMQGRIVRDLPGAGLGVLRLRRAEAIGRRDWGEAAALHEKVIAAIAESGGDASALADEEGLALGLDYQRGVLLLERDEVAEAADLFRRLLAREPRFIPARIMHGEAELLAGREDAAVDTWRHGYLETGSPVFLQRIEDHFIESQEPMRAIETLRGLIAEASNDLLPRFYLGRLYYRLEMLDDAEKVLESLSDRIRSSPTFHQLLGRIHERRGQLPAALEAYKDCLRELDLGAAEYVCGVCRQRYPEWHDFCPRCRTWNAIELNFEEEKLSAEEVGVQPAPVWGVSEDSGEVPVSAVQAGREG